MTKFNKFTVFLHVFSVYADMCEWFVQFREKVKNTHNIYNICIIWCKKIIKILCSTLNVQIQQICGVFTRVLQFMQTRWIGSCNFAKSLKSTQYAKYLHYMVSKNHKNLCSTLNDQIQQIYGVFTLVLQFMQTRWIGSCNFAKSLKPTQYTQYLHYMV